MELLAYKNGNKERILELENKFEINLPQDYKDFLLEYNGANVEKGYIYVKELNEYMLMGNLFGIAIEKGFADINKINDEYGEDIPEKALLIGTDAGNSFILLKCNDGEKGIWFYDDSYFFEQSTDELNTYFICETFTEFLEMLETTKIEDPKPDKPRGGWSVFD
jgi:hypothetical protein